MRDEVVWPAQHELSVPADLERVVSRCLANRPEDRFQDAQSLEQALTEWPQRPTPVDTAARRPLVAGTRRVHAAISNGPRAGNGLHAAPSSVKAPAVNSIMIGGVRRSGRR